MIVPAGFLEKRRRLAVGAELIDAFRWSRTPSMIVAIDGAPEREPRYFVRHDTGLFSLLDDRPLDDPLVLRVFDPQRRHIPRRFEIDLDPAQPTIVRPHFYPGSAYGVTSRSTGVFGRVVRGAPEQPVRWARLEARIAATTPLTGRLIGRTMADDRGEYLLLLQANASNIGALATPIAVELTAYGPLPDPPVPSRPDLPSLDPYWDVPIEQVPAGAGPTDPVITGTALPPDFGRTSTSTVNVSCPLGQLLKVSQIVLD